MNNTNYISDEQVVKRVNAAAKLAERQIEEINEK